MIPESERCAAGGCYELATHGNPPDFPVTVPAELRFWCRRHAEAIRAGLVAGGHAAAAVPPAPPVRRQGNLFYQQRPPARRQG